MHCKNVSAFKGNFEEKNEVKDVTNYVPCAGVLCISVDQNSIDCLLFIFFVANIISQYNRHIIKYWGFLAKKISSPLVLLWTSSRRR